MKSLKVVCMGLTALGLLIGCGSSGDGGGEQRGSESFKSTLATQEELGAITPKEATTFCSEWAAWSQEQMKTELPLECRAQAVGDAASMVVGGPAPTDAELQQACQSSYDQCLKAPAADVPLDCDLSGLTNACHATVAEAEACRNELFQEFRDALSKVPDCKTITLHDVTAATPTSPFGEGPACAKMKQKCPEAFQEDTATSNDPGMTGP